MEKWKTFPCKECLLKGNCTKRCFDFSSIHDMIEYVYNNKLEYNCICCGYNFLNEKETDCPECKSWISHWIKTKIRSRYDS